MLYQLSYSRGSYLRFPKIYFPVGFLPTKVVEGVGLEPT
jgi:hypothetical protein